MEIKLKNQTIAVVLIIILAVGAVGVWYFMNPPVPPEKVVILMGTTDSVESSLDMAQAYDYFGWEIITALSSGLVEIEPGSQAGADDIVPALATSWTISTDGLEWDFTLREGLTYDGVRPFNASCVKYTYDRNCNLTGVGLFEPDGPQLNMEYNAIIESVEVLDDYEVRFNLKIAFTPFLQLLSCAASYIVDPLHAPMDVLATYVEGDNVSSTPCGLGPYLLKSWVRVGGSDSEIRLVKNPYYWNTAGGYPKNDEIIIKMYLNSVALATAMTSGEIDIAYRQLTSLQIQDFRENADVRVWEGVGAQIQYLCFQQNIYPFNETGVRQAITAALNRSHVCNTVFLGDFDPLWSIIPAGMAHHKDSFNIWGSANYTYTVSKLAEYGYNATNKLVVDLWYESSGHYPGSAEQAAVYLSDFEASGVIDVVLHDADWPTYRTYRNAGSMPVFIYGWYPDFIDPDNYGFLPFASWLNLGYDSTHPAGGIAQYNLWVAGRSAATSEEREAAYFALQDLQATECSVVPLWQSNTVAVTALNVHGVVLDITVNWRHWLLYLGADATTGP